MSRRNLTLLCALAALAVLIYVWRSGKSSTKADTAKSSSTDSRSASIPNTESSLQNSSSLPALPDMPEDIMQKGMTPDEARAASIEKATKTLALFEETMRYPLFSRPADGSNAHILDWNKTSKVGQEFAVDEQNREVEAHFSVDKMFAGPGETLTGTLEVYRKDGDTLIAVAPTNPTFRIEYQVGDEGWRLAENLKFSSQGNLLVTKFIPSEIKVLREAQAEIRIVARVELGRFSKELSQPLRYSASPVFEVLGIDSDTNEAGSLDVALKVDIKHAAPVLIEAGLFDGSGTKPLLVYSQWHRPTQTGPQVIALQFFGKAIRESGVNGPYRIKRLHGIVKVPDAQPPEVYWSHPDEPALMTGRYGASDFSDEDYSSPEKDAKIKSYRDFIANPP